MRVDAPWQRSSPDILTEIATRVKISRHVEIGRRIKCIRNFSKSAIDTMRQTVKKLERAKNLESLLGYEGTAAAAHYRAYR